MFCASARRALQLGERLLDRPRIAPGAPLVEPLDLPALGAFGDRLDQLVAVGKRRVLGLGEAVDADHDLLAALDRLEPLGVGFHELRLHVAALDRGNGAAHALDQRQFLQGLALQLRDLGRDHRRAVEQVAVFQKVRFICHDLLHADRPLLVPGSGQAERLVPGRELHGARARILRQNHRKHFEQDAMHVVLGLLFGEPQTVHLHAVAEAAVLFALHPIALPRNLLPELRESAHLAKLGDDADAGIDEEGDAADRLLERLALHLAGRPHGVEDGDGGGKREGELLHRRRARLLQVIGADIHRIPFRHFAGGEQHDVLGEPHGGRRRKHMGAAREIFLDDVVLDRALELVARHALLVGERGIEREQPGRRRVDRHRGVHGLEGNALEQRAHVAQMRDRHADLADLALGERMIGVVAGLGRQIEGDRKAGLALRQIGAIEPVRFRGRRVARIGTENPGRVALDGHRLGSNAGGGDFLHRSMELIARENRGQNPTPLRPRNAGTRDRLSRHARACPGHPRLSSCKEDVDGRVKPGHDGLEYAGEVTMGSSKKQIRGGIASAADWFELRL